MNYIIYILLTAAYLFSLYKIFEKAGYQGWKAIVPVYNIVIWLKVIKKPWWWILLLIFPGVNILMLLIMSVNTSTVLGKRETSDVLQSAFLPFYYLPKLALDKDLKYVGPIDRIKYKKTTAQEWRDAILFAVVAASIIRTYFLEAFTIPTSSMEKTLLKGDFLFVSKMHYGPRIPETPLSFPFTHHTLPVLNIKSYLDWIELPYYRLPALTDIERNDIVVFNFPAGDTVHPVYQSSITYDAVIRLNAYQLIQRDIARNGKALPYSNYIDIARKSIKQSTDLIERPVDKRENYIKRCVGIPGDTVKIVDGNLFINGVEAFKAEDMQFKYIVRTKQPFPMQSEHFKRQLKDDFLIDFEDQADNASSYGNNAYLFPLTSINSKKIAQNSNVTSVELKLDEQKTFDDQFKRGLVNSLGLDGAKKAIAYFKENKIYDPILSIYPNKPAHYWTVDNFGELVIPKKGMTIELTQNNIDYYQRAITVYEGNTLYQRDGKVYINDQEADSYTFKMNYYWLMGDNRHNSQDSRFWGFVPEDHVVGKAVFIWLSLDPDYGLFDGKIRWSRLFSFID